MNWIKNQLRDYKLLLRSIPGVVTTLFCISVIVMNLMANKIILSSSFVAADGGILLSWVPFLCMDIITKRYGPKAATKINILALVINLFFVGIFALVSSLHIGIGAVDTVNPSDPAYGTWENYWAQYSSFDATFSCTWFVLLGSSIAFLASGIVNNFLNWTIGKMFVTNPDGKLAYVFRSYISTFIGQFVDNFLFAAIVFLIFAPIYWGYSLTIFQVLGSSVIGAFLELMMEVIFSPIGYKVTKKWVAEGVGKEYLMLHPEEKKEAKVRAGE